MGAGALGYLLGTVMIWILPAAFVAYGRSQNRSWATTVGVVLAVLIGLSAVGRGLNIGDLIGAGLVAAAFLLKPKAKTPSP